MTDPLHSRNPMAPAVRTMSSLPAQGRRAERGFTLLELVLAMALIAFVASFAISSFFSLSNMTLHNAAKLLADDIHDMQSRATTLQIPVDLVFDPAGDGYHAEDRGAADLRRGRLFPLPARRYSSDAVFEGVRIRRLELKGSDRISFDPSGRSQTAGTIVVGYHDDARVLELRPDRGFTHLPDSPHSGGWLSWLR
jgi:prepilin-type N-terminal cleavage/methylation domain-containing protein